jgi:hypothetical protein
MADRCSTRDFGTHEVPRCLKQRSPNHKLGTLQSDGVITAVAAVYNHALYIDEMREAIRRIPMR